MNLPKWYVSRDGGRPLNESTVNPAPDRLKENSHLLKPPINNYCVYNGDFTVMV